MSQRPLGPILTGFFGIILLSGCSVGMALSGDENPDIGVIREGTTRAQIEQELGDPVETEEAEEGGRIDTYEYVIGDKSSPERAALNATAFVFTLGIYELFATPAEAMRGDTYHAVVTYDANDVVKEVRTMYVDPSPKKTEEN